MIKKAFLSLAILAMVFTMTVGPALATETPDPYLGAVVKLADSDTLYYIAADGKRYVYPNEKIYKSWFFDFSDVKTVTAEELANYPLAGNISYRPGVILIKVQTDPKVYAVGQGGVLRWIKNEFLAKKLYGNNWASLIDDLPAGFFANYRIGDDIDDDTDYDADEESSNSDTFEKDRGLHLGQYLRGKISTTLKCRIINRVRSLGPDRSNRLNNLYERICHQDDDEDEDEDGDEDENGPVISSIVATASTTSAVITWTTNEASDSKIEYATTSLNSTDDEDEVENNALVTSHSLTLTGLTASTTYYFIVESEDEAGNKTKSTQKTFTTTSVTPIDETAPVISSIVATASTTSAIITWTTNEASTSKVQYASESLTTASSTDEVLSNSLVTSHSLELTGLTASTTYYFIIESKDASNNKATSTEQMFTSL